MLAAIAVFELTPAVREARLVVPEAVYELEGCGCQCVADARPWHSRVNYWFWFWVLAVPLIVFARPPEAPAWQRATRTLVAIAAAWPAMFLATLLSHEIVSGPFVVRPHLPDQKSWDMEGCANIGDGLSVVFYAFLGWIPATVYTGWWEFAWRRFHCPGPAFRRDPVSLTAYWAGRIAAVIIGACAAFGLVLAGGVLLVLWIRGGG